MKLNISPRPWVKIPVEIAAREFEAKLFLTHVLARKGWGVLIGQENLVRSAIATSVSGIQYDKSIAAGMKKYLMEAQSRGDYFTAHCEEGLVYLDPQTYIRRKICPANFMAADAFFFWGNQQYGDVTTALNIDYPHTITGNPRIDLLRKDMQNCYKDSSTWLKNKLGEFILINTKFGRYNPFIGREIFYQKAKGAWGIIKTPAEDEKFRASVKQQEFMYHKTLHLIDRLAKEFSSQKIVIKPHPAENWFPYVQRYANAANIHVAMHGASNQWLAAAQQVIHNSCTTGIEAFLLGKPVYSYEPYEDTSQDAELPALLSTRIKTEDELMESIVNAPPVNDREKRNKLAEEYMANLSEDMAAVRIANHFNTLIPPIKKVTFAVRHMLCLSEINTHHTENSHYWLEASYGTRQDYKMQKFPAFTTATVAGTLQRFSQVLESIEDMTVAEVEQ
ncbi:surface carbohydrate biosynthesis protein [Legionella septentrionalis]|uniref:surface carbohydrate biosynthesis protein n=1 Tax=Legionella septentrionalis TaxID=2498109 RepID=UPI000F8F765B|nr:surface carbohydrate biosynthesis protein [Legionella septentrionalis]RUQ95101.1 hypothetical protein ELY11_09925 [Legionella septentrionalis]